MLPVTVAGVVVHRRDRPVDRQLGEVRAAEPDQLGIQVGEQPGLQQRVVREVDAGDDVLYAERHLLGLGEEIVGVAVEHQPSHRPHRHPLLRNDLRRVEKIEVKRVLVGFRHELHAEFPLRERTVLDRLPQVPPVEVGVLARDLLRLVPDQGVRAELRPPVELDEGPLPGGIDEPEGVHAEALHHPVAARQCPVRHQPHHHVHRLGDEADEVPQGVVRGGCLRDLVVRLRLHRMDEVGELDTVLNEEYRHVVTDEIEVTLLGIKFDGKSAYVPDRVRGTAGTADGREPYEHRGTPAGLAQAVRPGHVGERLVRLEVPVGTGTAGVDDPLGDALVIEPGELLPEVEVLQQRRTAFPRRERVVGVFDTDPLVGGHAGAVVADSDGVELLLLRVVPREARRPRIGHDGHLADCLMLSGRTRTYPRRHE